MLFQYSAKTTIITLTPIALSALTSLGIAMPASHTLAGFGEDEFLTIEMSDDDVTTVAGADGYVVRSSLPNVIGSGTLTLQQTSPSNLILEAYREADKQVFGAGIFQMEVTVPTFKNGAVISGFGKGETMIATAYVTKMADYKFGKESGERAWGITVVDPLFKNSKIAGDLATIGSIMNSVQTGLDLIITK